MPPRSLHPTHPCAVDVTEHADGTVDIQARCGCRGNLGPRLRLRAGHRPRDRVAAYADAVAAVRLHERMMGVTRGESQ